MRNLTNHQLIEPIGTGCAGLAGVPARTKKRGARSWVVVAAAASSGLLLLLAVGAAAVLLLVLLVLAAVVVDAVR